MFTEIRRDPAPQVSQNAAAPGCELRQLAAECDLPQSGVSFGFVSGAQDREPPERVFCGKRRDILLLVVGLVQGPGTGESADHLANPGCAGARDSSDKDAAGWHSHCPARGVPEREVEGIAEVLTTSHRDVTWMGERTMIPRGGAWRSGPSTSKGAAGCHGIGT